MPTTLSLGRRPMVARDPHETHRSASPLELFFDLVFVVAVGAASVELHHQLSEGHVAEGVGRFVLVFFAVWWAWMNFTWFASSFDNDDWQYRLTTIVQMAGVLVLAAGAAEVTDRSDELLVVGYLIMRLAMVSQWLRVVANVPEHAATARRYALGITVVQVAWVLRLLVPGTLGVVLFVALAVAEVLVVVWAERGDTTPWHPGHVAERFGLFTLIVLGESLLASANAVFEALAGSEHTVELVVLAASALVVVAGLWWTYFWVPQEDRAVDLRTGMRFSLLHFAIFGAAAAVSSGIEAAVDVLEDHSELTGGQAAATLTVPVGVFLLGVWVLAIRDRADGVVNVAVPLAAVAVLATTLLPTSAAWTALVLVVLVGVLVARPPVEPTERAAHV